MTQTQMTPYLAGKLSITRRQVKSTLDELNELVTRQLKKEGSLRLAGLGVFRKRELKARVSGNPADQDSGADPFTFYTREGIERFCIRRTLAIKTDEILCMPRDFKHAKPASSLRLRTRR